MGIVDDHKLDEIYKMTKENNRMLKSQRRGAWFGFLFKIIIYALMIGIPIWFYIEYLQPVVQSAVGTIQQAQATSEQVGAQFGEVNKLLEQLENIPGFSGFNQE